MGSWCNHLHFVPIFVCLLIVDRLSGFPPFFSPSEDDDELFDVIISGKYDYPAPYWDQITDSAKDFINKLMNVDPKKRYTAEQALNHTWIKVIFSNCH